MSRRALVWSAALSAPWAFSACSASSTAVPAKQDPSPVASGGSDGGTSTVVPVGGGGAGFGEFGASGSGGVSGGAGGSSVVPPGDAPVVIDECIPANPAGLSTADAQTLMAGSGSAGGLRWLNPYDATVFPRGLLAPLLMWDGPQADTVYVHIQNGSFDYKGCFIPTGPNQLQLPQAIWDGAGEHAGGPNDPFTLELTVSSGGTIAGPVTEQFVIAQATLKGSIYYNTYSSTQLTGSLFGGGAVLRIPPGKTAELFLGITGCTGCHSVSANGSRLTSMNFLATGASYELTTTTAPNPPPLAANAPDPSFTGLYPDGSLYVTNAHQGGVGPRTGPTNLGTANAGLFETDTGAAVSGSGIPVGAMTATFSPDGSLLTFTDFAINGGRGLAIMDFDIGTRQATNYRQIYQTPDQNYAGWPFVLPDNGAVVYAVGNQADFSGGGTGIGGSGTAISDLYVVDLASGNWRMLANAMGFASEADAASSTSYLPFGGEELHHNYYPTVSPVAAGGYFWVFFDSYRHYGNLGMQRVLWGTAITVSSDGSYESDPSNPPFYVTGQEAGTGNHRAFTALDPCRQDGDSCTTGVDCCGGFCTNGTCNLPPMPPPCANTDESCASSPCCNDNDQCINGYCGQIIILR